MQPEAAEGRKRTNSISAQHPLTAEAPELYRSRRQDPGQVSSLHLLLCCRTAECRQELMSLSLRQGRTDTHVIWDRVLST